MRNNRERFHARKRRPAPFAIARVPFAMALVPFASALTGLALTGCGESSDQGSGPLFTDSGAMLRDALADWATGTGGNASEQRVDATAFDSGADPDRDPVADSSAALDATESAKPSDSGAVVSGDERDGNARPPSDASIGNDADAIAADQATIVPDPSWSCGLPDGIPAPESGKLVFHATLQLGATHDVGLTQYGKRRVLDVKGGTLKGERIEATILTGGFDFELTLANGALELEQIQMLRTSDGKLIYLRTCGVAAAGDAKVRIVPDFEVATSSSLAWLNTGKFAGTRVVDAAAGTIALDIYDVSQVAPTEPRIRLKDPADTPNQPWDCSTKTGAKGASVFTEAVTLGASLSVGASKHGTRNVIPITGGTVSGRVSGSVVPGGGDYQLIGATTVLDAKYVLSSKDGEFVVVRNCGPMGALVPLFEARSAGPYAFLNSNSYVSSDPGSAAGGVGITFYERN